METRKVMFNDECGVFLDVADDPTLGQVMHWGMKNPGEFLNARTFKDREEADDYIGQFEGLGWPAGCRMVEVGYGGPGQRASEMNCRDRLLPGWL